ncbi:MAG: gliding motility-associated ABC transporter permease subunit GldF [Sphingobacteriales bacterium 17-39-43]|uniref:gliding motility-associated ABC transporter permease subunit GldF n=1 Tax=Daejeonella sp. TaxID=2805397 RepID=UPI000BC570E0|nr:gliding motility-associated ABC transporter permease subunit GldF [Daejeonella sp.]OYX95540.1 MAG: gliding motility-associated ABC transporter permease subunit GldF [Sphingobacteriia bacterium 35-40-5]OYZ33447.1 MAG: gliding motility-associated ABC transporter permease subunit GldF [Sphingobacteriales bacterium 16-39-50]OZA24490.1 MAG: gliding motility-associated ABC transporter permease subunit GldF [Sphingobacteriales bacterium 17-39-43]HQT22465.1 gliding motility-associated ABC transporte
MLSILNKEISGFFSSLAAYISMAVFLLVTGLFLWVFPDSSILDYGYAGLDSFFNIAPYMFMFLIPAVTMRSLAEEKKDGTFELLATRPLSDWHIVLGKFLASLLIVVLTLVPTLIYYISVYQLGISKGNIDTGAVIGSYLGLILLGGAFTSIGLFTSSFGKNQIIAFTLSVFLCFITFSAFDSISKLIAFQAFESNLISLGINQHYQSISRGVVDSRDFIYFLSFAGLFLLLTRTVLGARKW